MPTTPIFPFSNFWAPMWTCFFANLAPSQLAHHLVHPSVHLCTPLCTFAHPCTPLHLTFPGLVTLIRLSSDLRPPSGYHRQPSPSATRHSTHSGVGGIIVPSINRLWSPVWRLSACLESGTIYNILFNMQNPSKILLKLKLGNSKVLSKSHHKPLIKYC